MSKKAQPWKERRREYLAETGRLKNCVVIVMPVRKAAPEQDTQAVSTSERSV